MPFINVSTYLISDACVLLAVERESEQRDKGARRGSEYPKPQSWGCQCVQRCWSTDLSISVHLGCKGFFVFWRVFFVQHVRSCTSVFLYFFWISADVQKASSSARWKLLLSRIVLKRFSCVIFARTSWSGCAAERIREAREALKWCASVAEAFRSVSSAVRSLHTEKSGEEGSLFPLAESRFTADWVTDQS